ncbi:acyltransferase [Metabacillus arenae]|uniref:Acyltransferase n=1 Tax=Metabacillus arenae TaxID=2771434 RepID=A0A926RYQ3_9BACI|nr:acyltransferase [Metabacillus arenae]MBD1382321.1 acyltransferase [Metabacillus arenae]
MERNYAIDFIKFFAIFAVVVIHTFPLDSVMGFYMIDALSRFAVPFFFVASGYLFGLKMMNTREHFNYFRKYIIKIFKIYVCWLIFYAAYDVILILFKYKGFEIKKELINYFDEFSLFNLLYYGKGTSGYHLWFLTALIWSVLTVFIFFRCKKINMLFILSFVLNILGLLGQSYTMFFEFPVSTRDALFLGLFYTALGFFFADQVKCRKLKKLNVKTYSVLLFLLALLQVMEAFVLDKLLPGSHGEYFLSTIFLTAFLFYFVLTNNQSGKGLFVTKIGRNSLGIYVIHAFIINVFNMVLEALHIDLANHFLWNLVYTLFIFIISYFAYELLQYAERIVKKWNPVLLS